MCQAPAATPSPSTRAQLGAAPRAASAAHAARPAPLRGRREMSRRRVAYQRRVGQREMPSMRANRGDPAGQIAWHGACRRGRKGESAMGRWIAPSSKASADVSAAQTERGLSSALSP